MPPPKYPPLTDDVKEAILIAYVQGDTRMSVLLAGVGQPEHKVVDIKLHAYRTERGEDYERALYRRRYHAAVANGKLGHTLSARKRRKATRESRGE